MNAYDRFYLEHARISLGRMLDYAIYDLKYELMEFWEMFIDSPVSKRFECGEVSILVGKSGIELALMVTGKDKNYAQPFFSVGRSPEYWTGWALAYFQWKSCLSFSQITEFVPINEIRTLYYPYHEMDIRQFCDRILELYKERNHLTNLKRKRLSAGISQSQLARLADIPLRTLQQYEQGQKDINRARSEYLIALSGALCCDPRLLLETGYSDFAGTRDNHSARK